jgi:hypothetical protein
MENDLQQTAAIVQLHTELLSAALNKNGAFMHEHLHHEFIFTSPRAVVLNKDGFINRFVLNPDIKFDIFRLTDEQVIVAGNTGILYCQVQVKPVAQPEFWEKVTFTSVKESNKWLIITMHATFIP